MIFPIYSKAQSELAKGKGRNPTSRKVANNTYLIQREGFWQGNCTQLLNKLKGGVFQTNLKGWPATGKGMSARLKRLLPALRHIGIDVEYKKRRRIYLIRGEKVMPSAHNNNNDEDRTKSLLADFARRISES